MGSTVNSYGNILSSNSDLRGEKNNILGIIHHTIYCTPLHLCYVQVGRSIRLHLLLTYISICNFCNLQYGFLFS